MSGSFWPTNFEKWAEAIKNLATGAAFVFAGAWAYWHFRLRRERYPSAELKHEILVESLSDGKNWLRLHLKVENTGQVLLRLVDGIVRVQQLRPWPNYLTEKLKSGGDPFYEGGHEYPWPLLEEYGFAQDAFELEPNETDEFHFDFFLGSETESVLIYTYLSNRKKRGLMSLLPWAGNRFQKAIGWQRVTVYDVEKGKQATMQTSPIPVEDKQTGPKPRPGPPPDEQ